MGKQSSVTSNADVLISNAEMVSKILTTRVAGTIAIPTQTGNLKRFACANITVIATSKELTFTPLEFAYPRWVRTAKAKMIAGQCTYSINVPPNSQFYLTATGHGRFACAWIEVLLTTTGAALGPYFVGFGRTKTVNLRVRKVTCIGPPR